MTRRLLVAALLGAAGVVSATSAEAAEKAIWGPAKLPSGASAFPVYRDLGVDTLQLALSFAATAPSRPARPGDPSDPAYKWPADLDATITEARANGLAVALLVSSSPAWANGGRSQVYAPDPGAFSEFLAAASRRYPSVRRWMIWGEPNRDDRFLPNVPNSPVGPRVYARVLDAAYAGLKRVSRSNIVIGGMTWTGGTVKPAPFMRFMRLPSGRPPRLDWYGHNPFPFRFPNLRELAIAEGWRDISDLDTFGAQLRRTYGRRAKFWLSEFLVLSDRPSREFTLAVSKAQQARWLGAAYRITDRLPQVAGLGWLGLLDEPPKPSSSNYGLLTADGRPKPAFAAFRAAPARRFRPRLRIRRRIGRREMRDHGLRLVVRPKVGGRVTVLLRTRRGRLLRHVYARIAGNKTRRLLLRAGRVRRGRYVLEIRVSRGVTVRRSLVVR